MLINQIDINKHLVAFGDNSITVKSLETGKTAGVIRDARRLSGKSRNARQDFDAFEKIKKAGLDWRKIGVDRLVIHNNELYIFIDRKIMKNKTKEPLLFEFDNVNGKMDQRIFEDNKLLNEANLANLKTVEYIPLRPEDAHRYQ